MLYNAHEETGMFFKCTATDVPVRDVSYMGFGAEVVWIVIVAQGLKVGVQSQCNGD